MQKSRLWILILIMVVNALAYGTIIPLLYPYAAKFGIGPVGLSLLTVSFSAAQFVATPILGRLSDKYGRKPILFLCILGTSLSLALFAAANSILILFLARILDGITGGNHSVAQAVVADTTQGAERTKTFGILGAAFGFGMLLGPALGGIMGEISLTAPFWTASALGLVSSLLCLFFFKETLPKQKRNLKHSDSLFHWQSIKSATLAPLTGVALLVFALMSIAYNSVIIGFQSFTVDVLKLTSLQVGILFTIVGVVTIIMQAGGIKVLIHFFPSKPKVLHYSLFLTSITLGLLFFQRNLIGFSAVILTFVAFTSPQNSMATAILSERTKKEDQGGILGIAQSYTSLGQIIGPLLAGLVSTRSVPGIFLVGAAFFFLAFLTSRMLLKPIDKRKLDL